MRPIPILLAAALAALLAALPARADNHMVMKSSPHGVTATVDKLAAAVESAGAMVVARHDHAAAAEGAGMQLRPTTLLIFGNPQVGTPLMQENQAIGLDLPMRVLVYEDAAGRTQVLYHNPEEVAGAHGISADHESVQKAKGALDKLTERATAE